MALPDSDLIDQAVAADPAFNQFSDGETSWLRLALQGLRRQFLGQFSIHIQPDPALLHHRGNLVPLVVCDGYAAGKVSTPSRQVNTKLPGLRKGIQFPVFCRSFPIRSRQDVESTSATQFGPTGNGQRQFPVGGISGEHQATTPGIQSAALLSLNITEGACGLWFQPAGTRHGQLRAQPGQTRQMFLQGGFAISFGAVVNNADRPAPATGLQHPQHFQFLIPRAQRQDLPVQLLPIAHHAVQIDRQQMRFHFPDQLTKTWQMIVAVMKIVHDAYIFHPFLFQPCDDCQLILRLPEPAPVVVKRHLASQLRSGFRDGFDAASLCFHPCVIGFTRLQHFPAPHDPELRRDLVTGDHVQDQLALRIQ